MSSLYNRATPQQGRVLRIIEGAVKNALDAHPGQVVRPKFARSVAKRAAGTLTAQWPDVLAPRDIEASELGIAQFDSGSESSGTNFVGRRAGHLANRKARRSHSTKAAWLASLNELHTDIGILIMVAKWGGLEDRVEGLRDAARLVRVQLNRIEAA